MIERRRISPVDDPPEERLPDLSRYDLGRALRQAFNNGGRLRTGLEAEVDAELRRKAGGEARGFLVPWSLPVERRALGFGAGAGYSGLAAAQTTTLYTTIIDVLRAKLAVQRLGGRIENLTPDTPSGGGVALPHKLQAAQVSWVSDGSAGTESDMKIDQILMQPHTATAYTEITRRMLSLAGPTFRDLAANDLLTGLAVAIDAAALNGVGNGGIPLGIFQNPNLTAIVPATDSGNGGAPAWGDLVRLEQLIGVAGGDAPADARLGLVTSPEGRSVLRRTARLGVGGALPSWEVSSGRDPSTGELETLESCLGYPAVATINAPRNTTRGTGTNLTSAALGNFTDMVVNLFTGFDVLVDPYRQSTTGVVRISAFVDIDVALRHKDSFAILNGINPA
jgi:hypothetical protein